MKNKDIIVVIITTVAVVLFAIVAVLTINYIAEPTGYKCEEQRITTIYPDGNNEPKTTTECLKWTKE